MGDHQPLTHGVASTSTTAPTTGSRKKHRRNAGMTDVAKADVKKVKKLLGR